MKQEQNAFLEKTAVDIAQNYINLVFKQPSLIVKAIYEGDFYWLIEYGTRPRSLLLGNVPFLVRKEDGEIIDEADFASEEGLVNFFKDRNEPLDLKLIEKVTHEKPNWRLKEPPAAKHYSPFIRLLRKLFGQF